ncbi:cobalt ABC transporter permease [Mameliella sp. CS4]|uniref:cobalt ABC transporter permease n=1 Tax=Mameliella sp. CS4 TaxID=2862329 RepID=UPI001C5E9720|nr:cobalt ABC transporter permease [Mameliella sp. CS4]MBW4984521.1 cobalt ABC transporter permease [Mameliella sp. CS4]
MIRLALVLTLLALPVPALAHKVIAAVFPSGSAIEGEVGFSNGDMATDQPVQVFGPDGALLGETVTDEDGFFLFEPTEPVAHTFRADLGAGHVADVTMSAADVARILGVAAPEPVAPAATTAAAPGVALSDADRAEIARIVRDEMRPLRREIAAYREKNDLQTILGGMGYILGLFGLGFYIAARRQLKTQGSA